MTERFQAPPPPALVSTAQPAGDSGGPDRVDLSRVDSNNADLFTPAVSAQNAGSDLQIPFFDQVGQLSALNNQVGGDPRPVTEDSAGNGSVDLVTANVNEFGRVPGLTIENWEA